MRKLLQNISLLVLGNVIEPVTGGISAAIAICRMCKQDSIGIEFIPCFREEALDISHLPTNSRILFVGVSSSIGQQKDADNLVTTVVTAGHEIVGIVDGLGGEMWRRAFKSASADFNNLLIKPLEGLCLFEFDDPEQWVQLSLEESSPKRCLLQHKLIEEFGQGTPLLEEIISDALSSSNLLPDFERCRYLIRHFSKNRYPDQQIQAWLDDKKRQLTARKAAMDARQDLGDGIWKLVFDSPITSLPEPVDRFVLMAMPARVVVMEQLLAEGERITRFALNRAVWKKHRCSQVLDTLKELKVAVDVGSPHNFSVATDDEERVIRVLKQVLAETSLG